MDITKITSVIDKAVLKQKYNITAKSKGLYLINEIANLSKINKEDITKSPVYKAFVRQYSQLDFTNNHVKGSIQYLPCFPFVADNVIYIDGELSNVILQKEKYEGTKVMTTVFLNKNSYLRSQLNSVVIAESK
jgi:hypothetical protein